MMITQRKQVWKPDQKYSMSVLYKMYKMQLAELHLCFLVCEGGPLSRAEIGKPQVSTVRSVAVTELKPYRLMFLKVGH